MKFKCLPLNSWQKPRDNDFSRRSFDNCIKYGYEECSPVVGRDGQYYNHITKVYWFETKGKAYTNSKNSKADTQFLWEVKAHNTRVLSTKEKKAFREIINKTANKALRNQLTEYLYESTNAELVQGMGDPKQRLGNFKAIKGTRQRIAEFKKEKEIKKC